MIKIHQRPYERCYVSFKCVHQLSIILLHLMNSGNILLRKKALQYHCHMYSSTADAVLSITGICPIKSESISICSETEETEETHLKCLLCLSENISFYRSEDTGNENCFSLMCKWFHWRKKTIIYIMRFIVWHCSHILYSHMFPVIPQAVSAVNIIDDHVRQWSSTHEKNHRWDPFKTSMRLKRRT